MDAVTGAICGERGKQMSDDLISRETVLEFEEYVGEPATWDKPYPKGDLYVKSEIIERIPSVEPERRWIDITNDESLAIELKCSECGFELINWLKTNYCPNCGARMVGGEF